MKGSVRPSLVALRALKLGDLLAAVPALRALRRGHPEHRLVLACPAWLHPVTAAAGVTDVVDTPGLVPLDAELHHADIAVNLHGKGPQSTALLAATSPRRLLAFGAGDGPSWRDDEHERARWCRLVASSGTPADPEDLYIDPPPPPPGLVGVTIVHPGASRGSRRWPVERWVAVAAALAAAGHRVVITGTEPEVPLAEEVARGARLPYDAVLAGRSSLTELMGLVGAAELVLSGDTGVAHVASATRTPSVVVFAPVPPAGWGPPPGGPHIALWAGVPSDPHADVASPGLLAIGVADVLDAAERITSTGVGRLGPAVVGRPHGAPGRRPIEGSATGGGAT